MRGLKITVIVGFVLSTILYAGVFVMNMRNHDSTIPIIINSTGLLELSVKDSDEKLLEGLAAVDKKDGDLTDQIMVAGISHLKKDGTCNVKYVVFDSDHNSDELTRKVQFTDYKEPVFSLKKPLVYRQGENIDILERIRAKDSLDGDISDKIKIKSSDISNYQTGIYPVVLEVKNSFGVKSSIELQVVVQDNYNYNVEKKIQLSKYIVYINQGKKFDPYDYIKSVKDGDSEVSDPDINIYGEVDTDTPGCYYLSYTLVTENSYGMESETDGLAYLTVVVQEEK